MQLQTEQRKKILNILKELPPEKLDEVIDFALKMRKRMPQEIKGKKRLATIPAFHLGHIKKDAFDRDALYGEYLDRKLA